MCKITIMMHKNCRFLMHKFIDNQVLTVNCFATVISNVITKTTSLEFPSRHDCSPRKFIHWK